MTRDQRPGDLVVIPPEECVELLIAAHVVRIGLQTDHGPLVLPVNHVVHDGSVFFRTAPGSKLGNAAAGGRVAVETDATDPDTRGGWSVAGSGTANIVTDEALIAELHELPFEPWALPDTRDFWVRIDLERLTGRRIQRRP